MLFLKIKVILLVLFLFYGCKLENSILSNNQEMITDSTVVDRHGLLSVDGNKVVNKNKEPIALAGNSFFLE